MCPKLCFKYKDVLTEYINHQCLILLDYICSYTVFTYRSVALSGYHWQDNGIQ